MFSRYGIMPQISNLHGWGVHAYYLASELERRGIAVWPLGDNGPMVQSAYMARLAQWRHRAAVFQRQTRAGVFQFDEPVWVAAGNHPGAPLKTLYTPSAKDVLCICFEDKRLDEADLDYIRMFEKVFTLSSWNRDTLIDWGIDAAFCPMGVDTSIFHPPAAPPISKDRSRFTIYSGGKAELRKGQDIVLMAFKRFREKHDDAVLFTSWHNLWPDTMRSFARSPHGVGVPKVFGNGHLDVVSWAGTLGIPQGAVVDLPLLPHHLMARHMAHADVAVFPNRLEGATNLVAMECAAMGVPTLVSSNSGHEDLIEWFPNVIGMVDQGRAKCLEPDFGLNLSAGEQSIDELLALLETVYEEGTPYTGGRAPLSVHGPALASVDWASRLPAQLGQLGLL